MWLILIVLRLVHILSAIFWLGGMFILVRFLAPTARRTGADGARFMQSLVSESGLPKALTGAGVLTVLAGLGLYWFTSDHFSREWMRSPTGMTFSFGMTFGLLALLHGLAVQRANADKLAAIARAVPAGGAPSPEQQARMDALREKLARGGQVGLVLLTLAAAAMAIARYV